MALGHGVSVVQVNIADAILVRARARIERQHAEFASSDEDCLRSLRGTVSI
jgi:hypothetical protein